MKDTKENTQKDYKNKIQVREFNVKNERGTKYYLRKPT